MILITAHKLKTLWGGLYLFVFSNGQSFLFKLWGTSSPYTLPTLFNVQNFNVYFTRDINGYFKIT